MSDSSQVTRSVLESILDQKLQPLQHTLSFMSSQYDDLLKKYQEQEATIKYLKVENIALKSQVDGLKNEVNQQKVAVDSLEQYSRQECLEIRGIPSTPSEDTSDIVVNLAKLVNINLDKKDISISHHLKAQQSSSSDTRFPLRPPSIIVKFVHREDRN